MSYHFEFLQTPLIISPSKRSFINTIDLDTSSSAPSEVCLSRDISFVESKIIPDTEIVNQQQEKSDADFADIYERIDDFLDEEGLFIASPPRGGNSKGLEKARTVTLLQFGSLSETNLRNSLGSPFSDKQKGPSILMRRNVSSIDSRSKLSVQTPSEKSL